MSTGLATSSADARSARRKLWVGSLGLTLLVAAAAAAFLGRPPPKPLPVLYTLPPFVLTDERGQTLGSAQLAGRPYVADFIYTRCHDSCPLLTERMAELARRIAGLPVALVSFSVDPVHDTPEVLAAYARAAGADPSRWRFVTGPLATVAPLLRDGFKVSLEAEGPADPVEESRSADEATGKAPPLRRAAQKSLSAEVLHDNHLVVVDAQGRIRGFYPAEDDGLSRIRRDLKRLVRGE